MKPKTMKKVIIATLLLFHLSGASQVIDDSVHVSYTQTELLDSVFIHMIDDFRERTPDSCGNHPIIIRVYPPFEYDNAETQSEKLVTYDAQKMNSDCCYYFAVSYLRNEKVMVNNFRYSFIAKYQDLNVFIVSNKVELIFPEIGEIRFSTSESNEIIEIDQTTNKCRSVVRGYLYRSDVNKLFLYEFIPW